MPALADSTTCNATSKLASARQAIRSAFDLVGSACAVLLSGLFVWFFFRHAGEEWARGSHTSVAVCGFAGVASLLWSVRKAFA